RHPGPGPALRRDGGVRGDPTHRHDPGERADGADRDGQVARTDAVGDADLLRRRGPGTADGIDDPPDRQRVDRRPHQRAGDLRMTTTIPAPLPAPLDHLDADATTTLASYLVDVAYEDGEAI